jgi:hypothetical protein
VKTSNYDIDFVLRYADQAVQDASNETSRFWSKYAREQIARAVATHNAHLATLNAHPMPEEARQTIEEIRQAFEIAVVETFGLAQDGGWDLAGRWAHSERTRPMQAGRREKKVKVIPLQAQRALEICEENGWSLSKRTRGRTIGQVAVKMERSPRMVRRYLEPFFDTNVVGVKVK